MREIKFRAWNKENSNPLERMIYPATLTCRGRVTMPDGEDWLIPIMQYTGLKDKNGKEIWEGDIVKYPFAEEFIKGEVHYFGAMFGVGGYALNGIPKMSIEIIGNIYENPELLDGKTH